MEPDPYLLDLDALGWPAAIEPRALGIVDLDRARHDAAIAELPPFPLLGIGDPEHPLAPQLDAVIAPPFTLDRIAAQVAVQPQAAAVAVALLRLIEPLAVQPALVAESLAYGLLQGSAGHAGWLAGRPAPDRAASAGTVATVRRDDVLTITMQREAAHNAIDRSMRDSLREAFELAALEPAIRRVVLRGAGRSFSVGADLDEFGTTRDPATAHLIRRHTLPALAIAACAERLEAHVQGACVGAGLEMAAFAARLTASTRAWFHLPELAMGLIPGAGGCVSLTRRIGRQRTALLLLSGRRIDARHALGWGLVDALVDDDSGDDRQPHIIGEQA